jgi:hypothetical protein
MFPEKLTNTLSANRFINLFLYIFAPAVSNQSPTRKVDPVTITGDFAYRYSPFAS